MFFRQYYLDCLSHASYMIGDTTTGQAVVVDPQRDVAEYLADAEANGLTIVKLLETRFRLSAATLVERIETIPDLVLIDVRNPGEVALGTIAGARTISLPALLTSLDQLDQTAPTVVFCARGYRSAIASSLMRSHGFADVSDLIGGYTAWETHQAANYQAVK